MYKVVQSSIEEIKEIIRKLWLLRAEKVMKAVELLPGSNPRLNRAQKISYELRIRASQLRPTLFTDKSIMIHHPRPVYPVEKRIVLPRCSALIDREGNIWTPINDTYWFESGKFSKRIIDYAGYKVIKPGEPMPIIKKVITKDFISTSEKYSAPINKETRKIDPTAFDDLRYEGLE
jgi:hypothetical protein